jgi:phosphoserine phosphatase RsbU/P
VKPLSECRVLIVDDVKANVDVLVTALRGEYRLSVALDGEKALDSVAANPPDLVLLDILMPGIDGFEVCRRLRAAPATRELPIMFLSSLEDSRNKAQGFEAGGNDYLTKPFDAIEARARVKSLLRAKAYSDAVKEAAARELAVAREIQTAILPTDPSAAVGSATSRGRASPRRCSWPSRRRSSVPRRASRRRPTRS